jgi:hypothetical protein
MAAGVTIPAAVPTTTIVVISVTRTVAALIIVLVARAGAVAAIPLLPAPPGRFGMPRRIAKPAA